MSSSMSSIQLVAEENFQFPKHEMKIISHPRGSADIDVLDVVSTADFVSVAPFIENNVIDLTQGKWYYEVELHTGGLMQIGWAISGQFRPEGVVNGVGDDKYSWGYDGQREKIWLHDAIDFPNSKWSMGATVGVGADLDKKVIMFFINGEQLGWDIDISEAFSGQLGVFPAATMTAVPTRQKISFVIQGSKMKYRPDDFRPVLDGVVKAGGVKYVPSALVMSSPADHDEKSSLMPSPDMEPVMQLGQVDITPQAAQRRMQQEQKFFNPIRDGRDFFLAASTRDLNALSELLKRVDVNKPDNETHYYTQRHTDFLLTALHWAATRGLIDVGKILVGAGADLNAKTKYGRTPLMLAIENNRALFVQWFLTLKGVQLDAKDWYKRNALHYVCNVVRENNQRQYHEGILLKREIGVLLARAMRDAGVLNLNDEDYRGFTPLMLAAFHGLDTIAVDKRNVSLVKDLVGEFKADVDYTNEFGWDATSLVEMQINKNYGLAPVDTLKRIAIVLRDHGGALPVPHPGTRVVAEAYRMIRARIEPEKVAKLYEEEKLQLEFRFPRADFATGFSVACQFNNVAVAKMLHARQCNLRATDRSGKGAFFQAAKCGSMDVLKWMIEDKIVGVNDTNVFGETALHMATKGKHVGIVQYLLEQGAEATVFDRLKRYTPLHEAVERGSKEIMEALVEAKADVNAADVDGNTPLVTASCTWNPNLKYLLEYLVEKGQAKLNQSNDDGRTALFECARRQNWDAVRYLLKQGAVLLATKGERLSPLSVAVFLGETEVVQQLLSFLENREDKNEIINMPDSDGRTPFFHALMGGRLEVAKMLVAAGARPDHVTNDDNSAVHFACGGTWGISQGGEKGKLEMVKYVVEECGLDINGRNSLGRRPIVDSIIKGYLSIVKYMAAAGKANLESLNRRGESALVIAAVQKKWDMVVWLAESGRCDVAAKAHDGRTALHMLMDSLDPKNASTSSAVSPNSVAALVTSNNSTESFAEYRKSALGWILRAFQCGGQYVQVAACLYGCRFVSYKKKSHMQVLRSLDFLDDDAVEVFFEHCKAGVMASPSPVLACLRMVVVFDALSRLKPSLKREFLAGRGYFQAMSKDIVDNLDCSDLMAGLILEQPLGLPGGEDEDDTLLDLAFQSQNFQFLRSARVQKIVHWWWGSNSPLTWTGITTPSRLFRSPRIKFTLDVTSFLSFLVLSSALLFNHRKYDDPISSLEWILLLYGIGYIFSEITQLSVSGWKNYINEGWNVFDIIICVLIVAVAICRGPDWGDNPDVGERVSAVYLVVMTTGAVLLWARSLFLLTLPSPVFPLLLTVRKMMRDIYYFSALLLVILLSAFFAFSFVLGNEDIKPEKFDGPRVLLVTLFQRGLVGEPIDSFEGVGFTEQVIAQVLGSVYVLLTAVILVNLLIAMMNSTYDRVRQDAEIEYIFTRTQMRWRYDRAWNGLPTPINLLALVIFVPLYLIGQLFLALKSLLAGGEATFCAHCHTDQSRMLPRFTMNFFHMHNPISDRIEEPYFLDRVVDPEAFVNADINFLWIRREREEYERMVQDQRYGEELKDDEFLQQYSSSRRGASRQDATRSLFDHYASDKPETVGGYQHDNDVKAWADYGHKEAIALVYADELVGRGEMCICGRVASPISDSRYILEWISLWVFKVVVYPFVLLCGMFLLAFKRVFGAKSFKQTSAVSLRLKILAHKENKDTSTRMLAYQFFLEWLKPFWVRVRRQFKMGTPLEPFHRTDPLRHSKGVRSFTTETGLSDQIKSLQEKVNEGIQSLNVKMDGLPDQFEELKKEITGDVEERITQLKMLVDKLAAKSS